MSLCFGIQPKQTATIRTRIRRTLRRAGSGAEPICETLRDEPTVCILNGAALDRRDAFAPARHDQMKSSTDAGATPFRIDLTIPWIPAVRYKPEALNDSRLDALRADQHRPRHVAPRDRNNARSRSSPSA
jgi:hypothetical protein